MTKSGRQRTDPACGLPCRLILALALATPALQLVRVTFVPLDARLTLTDAAAAGAVALRTQEPLYVEYGSTVRASAGVRPRTRVLWNGVAVAELPSHRLFAADRGRVLVPAAATRPGDNELRVTVVGPPDTTFEFQARVHNYYGIAPDFPRAYVVADEAVRHAQAQLSTAARVFRCVVFIALGLAAAYLVSAGAARARTRARTLAVMAAPAAPLWIVALAGAASPLHIWLAPESVATLAIGSLGLVLLATWLIDHRRPVLRFAGVAIVNLALLEIGLRAVNVVRPSFLFYDDSYSRYRGQAGAPFYDSRFNAGGFNDVDRQRARPTGIARRIVAIGDSFVVGVVPYRDNFLTLLERDLSADAPTEIVKLGIAGTDPAGYLAMLVNEGLPFGPDHVMVNLFVGNDFEEPGRRIYEYSYTATLVRSLWRLRDAGTAAAATSADGHAYDDTRPTFTRERFLEIEVDRSWIYGEPARLDAAAARVVERLKTMHDVARRAGATFSVIVIPDEAQTRRELQAELQRAVGDAVRLDFDRPNRVLTSALEAAGIPALDLLSAFREAAATTSLYKPSDTHWNLAGNRLAAETIAPYVRCRLSTAAADSGRCEGVALR